MLRHGAGVIRAFFRIDLLVRLLVLAILLATVLPATGEGKSVAQAVSHAAIVVLFFLNGLRLPRDEVMRGLRHGRFLLPLAIWCFGAMALAGMGFARIAEVSLPPMIAVGFLFLGTLASTVQSATAYSSLAGGDVARSVVAAGLLNILGVFVTAPLFALLAGREGAALEGDGLVRLALLLILPFVCGQLLQRFGRAWVHAHPALVSWIDRLAIAIAVYVAFSGAVERGIWGALAPVDWAVMFGLLAAMLAIAFGGAWVFAALLRLDRPTRISFMFAGAHKSVVSGAPIALVLFSPADAGLVLVPLLAYHLLQLVVSAPLATRLARSHRPTPPRAGSPGPTTTATPR